MYVRNRCFLAVSPVSVVPCARAEAEARAASTLAAGAASHAMDHIGRVLLTAAGKHVGEGSCSERRTASAAYGMGDYQLDVLVVTLALIFDVAASNRGYSLFSHTLMYRISQVRAPGHQGAHLHSHTARLPEVKGERGGFRAVCFAHAATWELRGAQTRSWSSLFGRFCH
jgi:hypothetical protein